MGTGQRPTHPSAKRWKKTPGWQNTAAKLLYLYKGSYGPARKVMNARRWSLHRSSCGTQQEPWKSVLLTALPAVQREILWHFDSHVHEKRVKKNNYLSYIGWPTEFGLGFWGGGGWFLFWSWFFFSFAFISRKQKISYIEDMSAFLEPAHKGVVYIDDTCPNLYFLRRK